MLPQCHRVFASLSDACELEDLMSAGLSKKVMTFVLSLSIVSNPLDEDHTTLSSIYRCGIPLRMYEIMGVE